MSLKSLILEAYREQYTHMGSLTRLPYRFAVQILSLLAILQCGPPKSFSVFA
jgi:hypothetical protein